MVMVVTDRGELIGIQGFTRPHHGKVCHHTRGVVLEVVAMIHPTPGRSSGIQAMTTRLFAGTFTVSSHERNAAGVRFR